MSNAPTDFSDLIRGTFPLGVATAFGRSLLEPGGFFEVHEEDVRGERMAVFRNRMRSTIDILSSVAAGNPEREYLVDEERRLTYGQTITAVGGIAAWLQRENVQPRDRVGIYAANSIEWVLAFWGITAVGGVVTAMNSFWSDREVASAVEITKPVLILADATRAEALVRVCSEVPVVLLDESFVARAAPATLPQVPVDEDAPAMIMFTSGTTGIPKAVVHAHRTPIGLYQCAIYNALLRMGDFPSEMPPPPRVLVGPPFFHLSALFGSIVMYTGSGGTLVLRPGRFDEERTLQALEAERITHWLSVGSAAPRVATHPRLRDYDLAALSMVMVGGAPMTPTIRSVICEAFPGAGNDNVRMGYTSTEAGTNLATIGGEPFRTEVDSVGPVQDGVQVELLDAAGQVTAEGEIHIRSPFTMLEYLGDADATQAAYRPSRWLGMGDVGYRDGGVLYLNSRARDVIFVSSENVYPSEVENRLEQHPAVVEACVAGIDDPMTGQAVQAFVVVSPEGDVEIDALARHCREGLPHYKVPTHWELRTEPLPRNPIGKVLRSSLLASIPTPGAAR
jgi:acyl-CoA synthetase (AMP-forming)/AMP-acid ligase II